jgi:hypothetical protein
MKNPRSVNKSAPFFMLILLVTLACICGEQPVAPAPQPKVIPPPTAVPSPTNMPEVKEQPLTCSLTWIKPGGAGYTGNLPKTGESVFEWTEQPNATDYQIVVTQPNGSTIPYQSDSTTKSLYMENYKQAGEHLVTLSALDKEGKEICSINLMFTKDAVDSKAQNSKDQGDGEGSSGAVPGPVIVIPPIITFIQPIR